MQKVQKIRKENRIALDTNFTSSNWNNFIKKEVCDIWSGY